MPSTRPAIQSIILADDDEDDRYIFKDAIHGYDPKIQVETVAHGLHLMELLQHFAPDLLFLDLEMPYKNGLECLVDIRKNKALQNLPVIAFSSTTRPANIQTAYEMGAHLFMIKESSFIEFISILKSILQLDWADPDAIRRQHCINHRFVAYSDSGILSDEGEG